MSGMAESALGFAVLLGTGAALAGSMYLAGMWNDVMRPSRRGLGWALGQGFAASPDDLGLTFTERTHEFPGCTMPAWWVAGRAPESGTAVILLHGHGRSRWDSLRRIEPIAAGAALVVVPDLRGHGDAPGRTTLARREPEDVAMLVATIEAEHPGLRIVIAGHSLGAVVAIHAASLRAEAGSPIHAVTAWGPYDRVRTPFEARLRLRGLPVRPFSDAILRLWSALDGPERPTTASAALLRDTTLGIHADTQDPVSPMEDAERISSACAGSTVVRTVGVAHADLGT